MALSRTTATRDELALAATVAAEIAELFDADVEHLADIATADVTASSLAFGPTWTDAFWTTGPGAEVIFDF
jgi:hypothetical protein